MERDVQDTPEYEFLQRKSNEGVKYENFDSFYADFNKNTFLVGEADDDFKNILKKNAEEIYNQFNN